MFTGISQRKKILIRKPTTIYSNRITLLRQVVEQGDGALLIFFLNYFKSAL